MTESALPLQRDAELIADRTVGAVAADEILGAHGFAPTGFKIVQLGRYAAVGLLECFKPGAIAQCDRRVRTRKLLQDRIEPKLRPDLQAFGALAFGFLLRARRPPHARQLMAAQARNKHNVERVFGGEWTIAHRRGNAPTPAKLHGPDVDLIHLRRANNAVALLHQVAGDAAPAEFGGEREPDRSAADDQHLNVTHA